VFSDHKSIAKQREMAEKEENEAREMRKNLMEQVNEIRRSIAEKREEQHEKRFKMMK
jgi:hypothetical protein